MGVVCQILVKRPKDGIYRAGSNIRGIVKYAIDEPTEYRAVVLSFVGNATCRWKEDSGNSSTTYTGTEEYFSYQMDILNNKGETFIIKPGTYEYPFEFVLPEDIPSSMKDHYCTIKYELELKFKGLKRFSGTKKFNTEITVRGYVKPTVIEGINIAGIQKKFLNMFSKKNRVINVKAELSNAVFKPSDDLEINYVVTNDTNVTIPTIRTEIVENVTYTANCGRKKRNYFKVEVRKETPSVPENAVANMSTVIPILPHLYSIHNSKIILREYLVRITLRLPMPHINSYGFAYICVGHKHEDAAESNEELDEDETEDEPPSYWEVMNEDGQDKDDDDDDDEKLVYEDSKTEQYGYEDSGTEKYRMEFDEKS